MVCNIEEFIGCHIEMYFFASLIAYRVQTGLFPCPLGAPTRFEIGPDPLAPSHGVLGKLPGAGVDDGLDLLLRLFRDRDVSVEVFVNEQADKHLGRNLNHYQTLRGTYFLYSR